MNCSYNVEMRKISHYIFPLLILFLILGVEYQFPQYVEEFQSKIFDVFQRIKPREFQPSEVQIIDIDDESLSKIGQWPWPRTILAELVKKLSDSGAKAIAFDIVFAEPDRSSAKNIIPLWPKTPLTEPFLSQIDEMPNHDKIFAEAISKAPVITAFGLNSTKNSSEPQVKAGFTYGGDNPAEYLVSYRGATINLEALGKAASGNGCFNTALGHDSTIRKVPMLFRYNNILFPSLAAEALRISEGASTYKIKSSGANQEISFGEKTGITKIKIGSFVVPTDSKGRILLYDTGHIPQRNIPVWKILANDFEHKLLKDKILFIGTSAAGLKDIRSTPLNPAAAGVEIHAQLVEQIILRNFLTRPDWAIGAEFCYLIILGLILIFLLPRAGAFMCALLGGSFTLLVIAISWICYTRFHLLIDPVFPSLAVFLIYSVSSFINFIRTEKERGEIRNAFSRYLSPILVEKLAKDPKQLKLGGENRNMTFLFADIKNFTSISENLAPEDLTLFINKFLTPMTNIILQNNGTIDKYMGDCIMAFWNAPLENTMHAENACQAAWEMQTFLKKWNMNIQKTKSSVKTLPEIQIGIGINTGIACVGNMGSEQRFDYSVLGEEVNLASRLEGLSKNYELPIVLSQNTLNCISSFRTLEIDLIQVKGSNKPIHIFTLLGKTDLEEFKELLLHQTKMLTAYRKKDWLLAEKEIENCLKHPIPEISLKSFYNIFISRINFYKENPPNNDWNGITIATSK